MPFDKFNIKYFHPSKAGGFFYQMSDNPRNDSGADFGGGNDFDFPGNGILVMNPNGPTDFGVGKHVRDFGDSIGGCNMDFGETAERGYAAFPDDARDIEFKALVEFDGISSGEGFSISACTGHHPTTEPCCQGFAYMLSVDPNSNPARWRFRKEMLHVSYHNSPEGEWTHSSSNFQLDGLNRYVGIGFCRYNDPQNPNENVILEAWFNPNPEADLNNWIMIKRITDRPGNGWGNDGDECGGDSDQVGTWSNAQNRMKTNSSGGTVNFKAVSLREIDPSGSFDNEPIPPTPQPQAGPLIYSFDFKWGSKGNGNGQFQDPHDITFDATGANLWVCDRVRNDFQKFTSAGVFVSKFGSAGSGDGEFNVPYAMEIDPTHSFLYVCDRGNNRIQKLTLTGSFVSKITSAGGKNLKAPEDICFNSANGDIFICDTGNNRVVKLNSAHSFLTEWNGGSGGGTQFDHPHSMDITVANTHILVSCGDQPFTQKFTTSGTFVKKWGSEGNGQGQVRMFLEHGDIDIFDRWHLINNDVRPIINVWDVDGNWITQYGATTAGSGNGQFKEPEHVTCHPVSAKPYVVDAKNQRIQVFKFTGGASGGGGGGPVTPPPPVPPTTPAEPTEVVGIFSLMRDINQLRVSPCSGTTPPSGGGGGTSGIFYGTGVEPDNETKLSDSSQWSHRTRHTIVCGTSASIFNNKIVKQLNVAMIKTGSPSASPTVSAKIWNKNGQVMFTSPTNFDPTTLPTTFPATKTSWAMFDFSANTYVMTVGDRVGVEYLGTSSTNYVRVGYEDDPGTGNHWVIQMENGVWQEKKTRDAAMLVWS